MKTIMDYLPENAEIGVGLALKDSNGDYLFFLAGSRHRLGTIGTAEALASVLKYDDEYNLKLEEESF